MKIRARIYRRKLHGIIEREYYEEELAKFYSFLNELAKVVQELCKDF